MNIDSYAAWRFVQLMDGKIKCSHNQIYVFDISTGLWTNAKASVRQSIEQFDTDLTFEQVSQAGDIKRFNLDSMLKCVSTFCLDDDFIERDTSRGKLLFKNGIYDCVNGVFELGFDQDIVFTRRISRDFPQRRDEAAIQLVNRILFEDPFVSSEQDAGVFLKKAIARAMHGDFRNKAFYFCIGSSNTGRGVLADALHFAFMQYIGTFNAEDLLYNSNAGGDDVRAKQMSWLTQIQDNRINISNNILEDTPMCGIKIKAISSDGDNPSTEICMVNNIPNIVGYDDGITNRVFCIDFKREFVRNVTNAEVQMVGDPDIKDRIRNDTAFQDALCHVIFDAMRLVRDEGLEAPESVVTATRKWTNNTISVRTIVEP